jgi:UDPglucose 6-dehydrogenase
LPIGGPTAAVLAFKNPQIQVTVVDKDERRIRRWNSRHLPIYEPGLAEIVRISRDGLSSSKETTPTSTEDDVDQQTQLENPVSSSARAPNLFFSANVAKCIRESDIVIIAVNTPTKMRGAGAGSATDMTAFEAVAADVVQHAKNGAVIVEKSTVPCRTAQMIQEIVRHSPSFNLKNAHYFHSFRLLFAVLMHTSKFCLTPNSSRLELPSRTCCIQTE